MALQELWVSIIVILGLCFQFYGIKSQNLTCDSQDSSALLGLFPGLESNSNGFNWSSSTDCCTWLGITCNSSFSLGLSNNSLDLNSGRVTKLQLHGQRLFGELGESIAKLDQLTDLDLSQNSLRKKLPLSLFHLPKLQVLDLSSNDFSGQIPQTINLPSLEYFDISENSIDGFLPTRICENSTRITVLVLTSNYLSGEILPGLGNCSFLEQLDLGMNDLTGIISEDIFELKKLKLLIVQDNRLSGKLSSNIGNLSNLVNLDISLNRFEGLIPDVFYGLKVFETFVAESNRFEGTIPSSLSSSPSLKLLHVRNNSLSGPINLNCSAMASLISLNIAMNMLNGSIPDNLPSCRVLTDVNLARNSFIGEMPRSFETFDSLSYLSVFNNSISNISSALQILQHCKNLEVLLLTRTFRGETMPDDSDIKFVKLKALIIPNCGLTGSLPTWLTRCTKMQLVDLSWNRLSGKIPSWVGNFEDLFYLDISNNSFTGEIPKALTLLPSLINRTLSLQGVTLNFPLTRRSPNGALQEYNKVATLPPTLDLGYNRLTGPIWKEFETLKNLRVLNLESNLLSGNIPSELSGMISLETLDLSNNNLSGTVPSSLVRLTFLSKFNVSYNQLEGRIPSQGQFATFPNSSFMGNKFCDGDCVSSPPKYMSEKKDMKTREGDFVIGLVAGVVFGTIVGAIVGSFVAPRLLFLLLKSETQGWLLSDKVPTSHYRE